MTRRRHGWQRPGDIEADDQLGLVIDAEGRGSQPWPLPEELNERIADGEAAIGPSYLMDERIYQRADGLDRVWRYSSMPLLEDLFYGADDLGERYGLASLRAGIAHPVAGADVPDEP